MNPHGMDCQCPEHQAEREHEWKKLASVIVCKNCGMVKGSGSDKKSKCDGGEARRKLVEAGKR